MFRGAHVQQSLPTSYFSTHEPRPGADRMNALAHRWHWNPNCPPANKSTIDQTIGSNGDVKIQTDNWNIEYNQSSQTMTVKDLNGKVYCKTQGDPHLYDGQGRLVGDFYRDGALRLPDGTTVYLDTKTASGKDWSPGSGPSWVDGITVSNDRQGVVSVNNLTSGQPSRGLNMPPGFAADWRSRPDETHHNFVVTPDGELQHRDGTPVSQQTIDAGKGLRGPSGMRDWFDRSGMDFFGAHCPGGLDRSEQNSARFGALEAQLRELLNLGRGGMVSLPAWQRQGEFGGTDAFIPTLFRFLLEESDPLSGAF